MARYRNIQAAIDDGQVVKLQVFMSTRSADKAGLIENLLQLVEAIRSGNDANYSQTGVCVDCFADDDDETLINHF